jgi:hypothetical protein
MLVGKFKIIHAIATAINLFIFRPRPVVVLAVPVRCYSVRAVVLCLGLCLGLWCGVTSSTVYSAGLKIVCAIATRFRIRPALSLIACYSRCGCALVYCLLTLLRLYVSVAVFVVVRYGLIVFL